MTRSRRLLGFSCSLLTAGLFLGCSSTPTHNPNPEMTSVTPTVNPEARDILTRNALNHDQQSIVLGAGDEFGAIIQSHHVALVRAEHGLPPVEAQIAHVPEQQD